MSKRRLDIDGGATKKPREDEGGLMPGKKMNPHTGEVKLSADRVLIPLSRAALLSALLRALQEEDTAAGVGVPGEVPGPAGPAPVHLSGGRDWVWEDHSDPPVVCGLLQEDGQEERVLHTAEESGRHVCGPEGGGGDGRQSRPGGEWDGSEGGDTDWSCLGRLQYQV